MKLNLSNRQEQHLAEIKRAQQDGAHLLCPRCGLNQMKVPVHTNALSRRTDIFVCSACGSIEAVLDFARQSDPIKDWAMFAPSRIDERFIRTPVEEAWEIVRDEHVPYLKKLYECSIDAPADRYRGFQKEALRQCPGLELLMFHPFYAKYETLDAQLVVRISKASGGEPGDKAGEPGDEAGSEIVVTHEVIPV